jgi:hypothetical protein
MTAHPSWTYSGAVPLTGDLSALEAELHTGRIEAVELGYREDPSAIETEDVMLLDGQSGRPPTESSATGGDPRLVSAEQAEAEGLPFTPTHTRFVMTWTAEA